MDQTFIRRKNGREEVEYLHPKLEKVLSNTYGSIVYQEQVAQIAGNVRLFIGRSRLVATRYGKKDVAEMDRQKLIFVERAANGVKKILPVKSLT